MTVARLPSGVTLRRAAIVLGVALVLAWHARSYLPLFVDDGFISLRYARRLLDGQGLGWSEGPPVEGYSNLLWVLGCAALGALGMDLVHAARALGLGSAVAVVAAVVAHTPRGRAGAWLPELAGGLCVALAAPLAAWAVGGLEGALLAALLAWATVLTLRLLAPGRTRIGDSSRLAQRVAVPSVLLGLGCLTRPDAPLLAAALCVCLWDQHPDKRQGRALGARLALAPALATAGQLVFRALYYHDVVPNTARVKLALTSARLSEGLATLGDFAASAWPLLLLALGAVLGAIADGRCRPRILLLGGTLGAWIGYLALAECDAFVYRSLVPAIGLLALLAAEGLGFAASRGRGPTLAAAAAAAVLLPVFAWSQGRDPNVAMARQWTRFLSWEGASIGTLLGRAFAAQQPLLAVDAAGAIPYFSGLPALDMLGLCDRHIARVRPAGFGHGLTGHELGDGAYVLDRAPDLVVPGIVGGRTLWYRGGAEMQRDPRFARHYRAVRFFADGPRRLGFWAHVRLDGRVGIERGEVGAGPGERWRIPGYLFASTPGATARLDGSGRLGVTVTPGAVARLERLQLGAGVWIAQVKSHGAPLRLQLGDSSSGEIVPRAPTRPGGTQLVYTRGSEVDLELVAEHGPESFVLEVVLSLADAPEAEAGSAISPR